MKNWKAYEIIWLATFSGIAAVLSVMSNESVLGFSVFITGVLCVVLAAKGNIWTYGFGMYNTFSYAYLSYTNGLFGETGLNLLFFAPMNIVGYFMWRRHMVDKMVEMRKVKSATAVLMLAGCVASTMAMGWLLALIPGQNTPYVDATTNVLSIVATFLMVSRYREQWIMYIVLNVFTIIMWSIRLMNGSPDGLMMVVMWSAYFVNSIYGYLTWSAGAAANAETAALETAAANAAASTAVPTK